MQQLIPLTIPQHIPQQLLIIPCTQGHQQLQRLTRQLLILQLQPIRLPQLTQPRRPTQLQPTRQPPITVAIITSHLLIQFRRGNIR